MSVKFVVSQKRVMTAGKKKNIMLLITRMAIFLATDLSLLVPARSPIFFTEMNIFMYKGTIVKYVTIPHKDNAMLISYECGMSLVGQ